MLITNVHILPIAQREIKKGYILVEDGIIIAIGEMQNAPKWQDVLDGEGAFALPGFIDAHSHIGLFGTNEQDAIEAGEPIASHLRAIDAINPNDPYFNQALMSGITTVVVSPGSGNVVGGQVAAVKTYGDTVDEMLVKQPIAVKVALGENPKNKKYPQTRMATVALLRETLAKAVKYASKKTKEVDFKLQAFLPVISGEIPLHVHAHTAGDIQAALRIADEFNIKIKLIHATESYKMADEIAQREIEVMCGPQICHRSKAELAGHNPALAAVLTAKKVKTAIITDHPETPIDHLPLCAALATKEGMPPLDALCAITINAAEIAGIDDVVGSIEPDKHADILLYDKFPLEFYAAPKHIITKGTIV